MSTYGAAGPNAATDYATLYGSMATREDFGRIAVSQRHNRNIMCARAIGPQTA